MKKREGMKNDIQEKLQRWLKIRTKKSILKCEMMHNDETKKQKQIRTHRKMIFRRVISKFFAVKKCDRYKITVKFEAR